ncbi:MAG: hypothetical protein MUO26_11850 [Methanotrichaceae archaeon]|nr:hypothetical protein [Methanotrichaceae archaeon]
MIPFSGKMPWEMTEYIAKALRQASYEATVLLYSPGIIPFFENLAKIADLLFYFEEGASKIHLD